MQFLNLCQISPILKGSPNLHLEEDNLQSENKTQKIEKRKEIVGQTVFLPDYRSCMYFYFLKEVRRDAWQTTVYIQVKISSY